MNPTQVKTCIDAKGLEGFLTAGRKYWVDQMAVGAVLVETLNGFIVCSGERFR